MRKILLNFKSVLLGTLIVVCFCSCGKSNIDYVTETELDSSECLDSMATEQKMLYIYVCGQIQNPGVYTLPEGSRIYDVFILAGGFTENSATDYWNQARLLVDGEMIYVPSKEEVKNNQIPPETTGKTDDSGKVNINTATKEILMTLPGIGETKAMAILAYRQEHGPFSSLEELKEVEGIKEAVFAKIKVYIEI